jgi:hypothetical protein
MGSWSSDWGRGRGQGRWIKMGSVGGGSSDGVWGGRRSGSGGVGVVGGVGLAESGSSTDGVGLGESGSADRSRGESGSADRSRQIEVGVVKSEQGRGRRADWGSAESGSPKLCREQTAVAVGLETTAELEPSERREMRKGEGRGGGGMREEAVRSVRGVRGVCGVCGIAWRSDG